MKKLLFVFLLLCFSVVPGYADPIQMDNGTYTAPNGYGVVAQIKDVSMSHNRYYTWGIQDQLNNVATGITSIDIVFHGIYDNSGTDNWLNVYIFNEPAELGYNQPGRDESDPTLPNWADVYNATYLGTWSYDHNLYDWRSGDAFDVVFTVTDQALISYLLDGQTWGLGFDPDCSFHADYVSVLVPVPEPGSMILLGISLVGIAGITRRRFKK